MKNCLSTITLLAALTTSSAFGLDAIRYQWDGKWIGVKNSAAGSMVVTENSGVIDIAGTDTGSEYRAVCIAKRDNSHTATCVGDGVNHENGNNRFIYRSEIRDNGDGTITETWECEFYQTLRKGITGFIHSSRMSR
ncbi:hypothetical protein [Propionivibrio sp.]|uniref:hypothetical protein n=1 Tax=Propionivibrio sp. TaxID=2212460 RepID=UPI003BF2DC65